MKYQISKTGIVNLWKFGDGYSNLKVDDIDLKEEILKTVFSPTSKELDEKSFAGKVTIIIEDLETGVEFETDDIRVITGGEEDDF